MQKYKELIKVQLVQLQQKVFQRRHIYTLERHLQPNACSAGYLQPKGGFPFSGKSRAIDFLRPLSFQMRAVNLIRCA
jgi:hypothetical protein